MATLKDNTLFTSSSFMSQHVVYLKLLDVMRQPKNMPLVKNSIHQTG